ncbi:MAG TPA: hypothetical protein VFR24_07685 [Candidatus Angelobacter sp.]|nr:hypothetical protein [Candidatus Angelobacter sp.]
MTIGTAIVIVMLLYLLDKHGLLKRASGIVALLAIVGLAWIFGQQQYRKWQNARYMRHHAEMKETLIQKYHNAVLAPAVQWDDQRTKSVPLDELDKENPTVKAPVENVPKLDPSEVEIEKVVYLDDICKEPQWKELDEWERGEVVETVMPKMDYFDRLHFVDKCR